MFLGAARLINGFLGGSEGARVLLYLRLLSSSVAISSMRKSRDPHYRAVLDFALRLEKLRRPLHVQDENKRVAYPADIIARLAGPVASMFSRGKLPLVTLNPSTISVRGSRSHEEAINASMQARLRRAVAKAGCSLRESRHFHGLLRELSLNMSVPSVYGGVPVFAPLKDVYAEGCRRFKERWGKAPPMGRSNVFRIISGLRPESERQRSHRDNLARAQRARFGVRKLNLFTAEEKERLWNENLGLVISQCRRVFRGGSMGYVAAVVLPLVKAEVFYKLDYFDPCKHGAAVFERRLLSEGVEPAEAKRKAAAEEARLRGTLAEWLPRDLASSQGAKSFIASHARFAALHEINRNPEFRGAREASLDAPLEERPPGRARSLLDKLGVTDASPELAIDLRSAMGKLSQRERLVFELRHLHDMTQAEVGRELEPQVTRSRVQQIEAAAVRKLREVLSK